METIQLNTPCALYPSPPQDTAKASIPVNINQKLEDLSNSNTYVTHFEQVTKSRTTTHEEILKISLEEFEQVNFEKAANPHVKGDSKLLS